MIRKEKPMSEEAMREKLAQFDRKMEIIKLLQRRSNNFWIANYILESTSAEPQREFEGVIIDFYSNIAHGGGGAASASAAPQIVNFNSSNFVRELPSQARALVYIYSYDMRATVPIPAGRILKTGDRVSLKRARNAHVYQLFEFA